MAAQRSRCNIHERMSVYTKRLKAFLSPLFYMTLENRCLETAYMLSGKKKSCVQSKQQHSALLGSGNVDVWEEGKRQGGKEVIRKGELCQGGKNCVKVSIQIGKGLRLVCATLSVASPFIVFHHGPNRRWPSVRFRKQHWPPWHASADSCNLNCPLESCTQAKWGKLKKNSAQWNMTGQFEEASFQLHAQNLYNCTPNHKISTKMIISAKSCQY